jgi:hypothetical protein
LLSRRSPLPGAGDGKVDACEVSFLGNTGRGLSVYNEVLMTDLAASMPAPAEASRGLFARVIGVFVSPRATYADVAARPRWFGALALSTVVVAGGFFIFLSSDVGKQAVLDQQMQLIESFGVKLSDAQQAQMESRVDYARYTTAAGQVIGIPLVAVIIAGIMLGIFNALLGGDATFKQVFAIVAHSTLITALQQIFALPLDYVRETMSSPTSLGVFAPFLEENSFLARLLGAIDLFQIWGIVSLAIGLGVLYKRRTAPITTTMFIVYFVIVAAVAAIRSALS